jgi:coenzyme PQQ synthesis protein D (PqqD)
MERPEISASSTVVASPSQVSREVDGEAVILNFDAGVYYGLEGVGAAAWDHLGEPLTVAELRDKLVAQFDVEPERCEADLRELLADLAEAGLIEVDAA